ncbi:MAG: HAD family phosphatase [Alphaproteobacteria bacterium]|nr:HAD family phosphatase [Alphaproteobacteria bacterium]
MPDAPVVIFDLGAVLIDWNPRHLYRKLFDDEAEMEAFLSDICAPAWNVEQDRGRSWQEAVDILSAAHPEHRDLIHAYKDRWEEMLKGPIDGSVDILERLDGEGYELHALTNWSAETFPIARARFDFLERFRTILVSGEEGLVKPDAGIFQLMLERIGHPAERCLLIDDSAKNIEGARAQGFDAIHFSSPDQLQAELAERSI